MSYIDWLEDWFVSNGNVSKEDIQAHLNDNYFEMGYIDSFGFIMLISKIEEELGIRFENDQFQNRSFSTINGLAKCMEKKS